MAVVTITLAFSSLFLIIIAVVLMTVANSKFTKGQIRGVFNWILIAFYFMAIPYLLFILRDAGVLSSGSEIISMTIYLCMIFVAVCLAEASFRLYKFSKNFGSFKPD